MAQCSPCADGQIRYETTRCRQCDRMTLELLNYQLRGEQDFVFDAHKYVAITSHHAHDWIGRDQCIRLAIQVYSGQEVVITIPTNEGTDL